MKEEIELFKKQLDLVDLERELKKLPQVEIPTLHEFMGGIYMRTVFIPQGTMLIGKRHRYETCNLLLIGEMSTYMGRDIPTRREKGPVFFKSEPGIKKLGYAHTDSIFINFHPTEEKDLEEIEKMFVISEEEYQSKFKEIGEGELKCLG